MTTGKGFVSPTDPWVLVFTPANQVHVTPPQRQRRRLDGLLRADYRPFAVGLANGPVDPEWTFKLMP